MSYHELVERWGVNIKRPLLRLALTHRSFAFEHDEPHNERLEFLGDSVLGFIAADKVFREFPDSREGDMSRMKTFAVSEKALASIARELDLGRFLRLGRGEDLSGGRDKDSILSDTVEALIAATYLEHGLEVTRKIVERLVAPKIDDASLLGPNLDWQTSFEEVAHGRGRAGSSACVHGRGLNGRAFVGRRQGNVEKDGTAGGGSGCLQEDYLRKRRLTGNM